MTLSEYIKGLSGKRVAVIGIGVSNTPLLELLLNNSISVTACDRNTRDKFGPLADKLEKMGAELKLGQDYLKNLDHDIIFKTPGLRPDVPELLEAKAKGSIITSEMEVFYDVCPCRVVAITGSDGKTTTTTVTAKLLEEAGYKVHLGGNIGNPLLADADSIAPEDYAVVELSSFQLMTMKKSADIAVITNIAPNHLDYHTSMDEYTDSKKSVYRFQKSDGLLVLNADNEITAALTGEAKGSLRTFSRREKVKNGCYFDGEAIRYTDGENDRVIIAKRDIKLPGLHNVENYMAAFSAVIDIVGDEVCRKVAREFGGVEHRIELVRELNGVRFYNDSIASSPTRSIAGLNSFDEKLILIAGGYDKHIPYDVIGPVICRKVKRLVLVGATSDKIEEAVMNAEEAEKPIIRKFDDFEKAVKAAAGAARSGDVVILSPASASFDLFKNFMERGERFKEIINSL